MSTLARIQDLAAKEFSIDPKSLDPHAQLDTLGIDSLSFIEFMFKVEEEFGVSVSDENRSEEHTSELQSLAYLVCRLLLEKKKKKNQSISNYENVDCTRSS